MTSMLSSRQRGALRQASVHDLIPSRRFGDGASTLMAALSPDQLNQKSMPSFILPAAEMPDLPSNAETTAAAAADAEALSASLLPPFGFDEAGGRAGFEPAVEETPSTDEAAGEAGEAGAQDRVRAEIDHHRNGAYGGGSGALRKRRELEVGGPVFFADEAVGFWRAGGLHVGAIPFDIFLKAEGDDAG